MSYEISWANKGIELIYTDPVIGFEQVYASNNELHIEPCSDSAKYILVDFSNVHKLVMDKEQVELLAGLDYAANLYIKNIKVALIGHSHSVRKIFADYIIISKKLKNRWDIRQFTDIQQARIWLLPLGYNQVCTARLA